MFYSADLLSTIAQDTATQIALRDFSREVREETRYIGVFAKKKNVVEHQNIVDNHENRHLILYIIIVLFLN